jgi:hypothetical protein
VQAQQRLHRHVAVPVEESPQQVLSIVSSKTPKSPTSLSLSTITAMSGTTYAYVAQARMSPYFQAALNETQIAVLCFTRQV